MLSFRQYITETSSDFIPSYTRIEKSAQQATADTGYLDMALGALGMDEAGRREREHNKALYNWHRTTDIKVQPANSGGTKARWAQQHQKGIAAKTAEENRTGQLQSDTQWQAEKELERLGHKDFSAAYSSDPLLMAWLKTKS